MIWLVVTSLVLVVCFGGVVAVGAPYLPTLTPQVAAALELAQLKPGETLLELGSGDGKVMIAAASQGVRVVGYELNPILVVIAWLRTRRYRKLVKIIWGDFWQSNWPPANAIFTFLLPKYMIKLDNKITRQADKPVKLITFAFEIPSKPVHSTKAGVYRYDYR